MCPAALSYVPLVIDINSHCKVECDLCNSMGKCDSPTDSLHRQMYKQLCAKGNFTKNRVSF